MSKTRGASTVEYAFLLVAVMMGGGAAFKFLGARAAVDAVHAGAVIGGGESHEPPCESHAAPKPLPPKPQHFPPVPRVAQHRPPTRS